VIICTLLAGGVSYVVARETLPNYRATTTLLVSVSNTPGHVILDDVLVSEQLTQTYSVLINTTPVMEDVAAKLGGPESASDIGGKTSASGDPNRPLITVSAQDADPARAALIANTVATVFIERTNAATTPEGIITVVEDAKAPTSRVGPSVPLKTAAGLLAGLSLALMLLAVVVFFDNSILSAADAKALGVDLPCFGVIRNGGMGSSVHLPDGRKVPALTTATRAVTGTTWSVLSTLRRQNGPCPVVAVVSATRGEGRTSFVASLGAAANGRHVTLVDLDLANPHLHERFDADNEYGMTDLMWSHRIAAPAIRYSGSSVIENLRLVPGGRYSETAAVFDRSDALAAIEQLSANGAEAILVDTPPLGVSAEALIPVQALAGAIIIVDVHQTSAETLAALARQLDKWEVPVLGYVLNRR
jgi:capsular polysaccharide biosynthesis protein